MFTKKEIFSYYSFTLSNCLVSKCFFHYERFFYFFQYTGNFLMPLMPLMPLMLFFITSEVHSEEDMHYHNWSNLKYGRKDK